MRRVQVTQYNEQWVSMFEEEASKLREILGLRTHSEAAKSYGDLKMKLAEQFPFDIESYIKGKEQLGQEIDRQAAAWYRKN